LKTEKISSKSLNQKQFHLKKDLYLKMKHVQEILILSEANFSNPDPERMIAFMTFQPTVLE
jgi:hypothetical protein